MAGHRHGQVAASGGVAVNADVEVLGEGGKRRGGRGDPISCSGNAPRTALRISRPLAHNACRLRGRITHGAEADLSLGDSQGSSREEDGTHGKG